MAAQSFAGNTKVYSLRPEKSGGGAGARSQNVTVVTGPGDLVTEILMHCVMHAQKMKRTPSTQAKCVFAQTTGGWGAHGSSSHKLCGALLHQLHCGIVGYLQGGSSAKITGHNLTSSARGPFFQGLRAAENVAHALRGKRRVEGSRSCFLKAQAR